MTTLRAAIALLGGAMVVQAVHVRPIVTVGEAAPDGTMTVTVRVVPTGVVLGSYQGALRFTPGTLRAIQASAPRGADATRMVNAADSVSGLIRYAGFTVTRFQHDTVLVMRVRPSATLTAVELTATLDVAADSAGTRIPRDRLAPSGPVARPRP
jgi:hypothetical protein